MSLKIAGDYIASLTDFYSKENAQFIAQFTSTSKDKGFELMLNDAAKIRLRSTWRRNIESPRIECRIGIE
jgi:hypothetical protein